MTNTPKPDIQVFRNFFPDQRRLEEQGDFDALLLVGYPLELSYNQCRVSTADAFKRAVGGIPQNAFLVMAPNTLDGTPAHCILLRVSDVAPTPLTGQMMQTCFELQKRNMPSLDLFSENELQWSALGCDVLGTFYDDEGALRFAGDVFSVSSVTNYKVYMPSQELLSVLLNSGLERSDCYTIGYFRATECGFTQAGTQQAGTPVQVALEDFWATRTACFGKTRDGKSNTVKLLMQMVLDKTAATNNVGQLVFDLNGEYANGNPQDNNSCVRMHNSSRCEVYTLTARPGTPSKPLRLNLYNHPDQTHPILARLLKMDGKAANYISSFCGVVLPSFDEIRTAQDIGERTRLIRKVQLYWAILNKAGFPAHEATLAGYGLCAGAVKGFDPHYNKELRTAAYSFSRHVQQPPPAPASLDQMSKEFDVLAEFALANPSCDELQPSGKDIFDADDLAMLKFLRPAIQACGPAVLRAYKSYHDANATDFVREALALLDAGKTVILDLGNAAEDIRKYFSDMLLQAVFRHQEEKFTSNTLRDHFVTLYFEEAHNLFPVGNTDFTNIYARIAKEGAKYHLGMVYSTQSPSTISGELLTQTENFFVGHLSSAEEVKVLGKLQYAYAGAGDAILRCRTPGYMRMLTRSNRFVIPVQVKLYKDILMKGGQP